MMRPGAECLSALTLWLGIVGLLGAASVFLKPFSDPALWRKLPRSVWPGRIMTVVCMVWAALWLRVMPLGPLDVLIPFLPYLAIVAIVATCYYMDELLSCRAIGGLMVLVPLPFLTAAQWHPSAWRYLVLVIAYVWLTLGMWFIASPFRLRDLLYWSTTSHSHLRYVAIAKIVLALGFIILSQTAYKL